MTDEAALPPKISILGTPVSLTGQGEVLALADRAVAGNRPLRIGVTNHNKCWLARSDAELRSFLAEAEVVVPETSAVWAARFLGRGAAEPVWGVSLMEGLLDRASAAGWAVYLLGSRQDVVDDLVAVAEQRWPGARLVGSHHGYFDESEEPDLIAEIRDLRPDLLLVAMGSPRQERFMRKLGAEGARVMVGVGGSFEVHAGHKPDAPAWIRGSGLEWLYRTLHSPRLLRRYLVVNPWFVGAVVRERLTGRTPALR